MFNNPGGVCQSKDRHVDNVMEGQGYQTLLYLIMTVAIQIYTSVKTYRAVQLLTTQYCVVCGTLLFIYFAQAFVTNLLEEDFILKINFQSSKLIQEGKENVFDKWSLKGSHACGTEP